MVSFPVPIPIPYILKEAEQFHKFCLDYYHPQKIADIMTAVVCVVLFFPSIFVFIRIFWIKEKAYLMLLISLFIIGELAGVALSYCINVTMNIGYTWSVLIHTDPLELQRLTSGIVYCVAVFFTSFNVAHWLFSMQYWSLSLRLHCLVERKEVQSVQLTINIVLVVGILVNITGGVCIYFASYHPNNVMWTNST